MESSHYLDLDGRPFLVVTTFEADKLGIFAKHRLRVLPLGADRSRSGRPPTLELETKSRRWQRVDVAAFDADGDGHDDLTVLHEDGMDGDAVLLDTWFGRGDGGFERRPSRASIPAKDARWWWGEDLTGDDLPDLLVRRGDVLELYPMRRDGRRKEMVAERPSRTVRLEDLADIDENQEQVQITVGGGGTKVDWKTSWRLRDVVGDGRAELVQVGRRDDGADLVRVVVFE